MYLKRSTTGNLRQAWTKEDGAVFRSLSWLTTPCAPNSTIWDALNFLRHCGPWWLAFSSSTGCLVPTLSIASGCTLSWFRIKNCFRFPSQKKWEQSPGLLVQTNRIHVWVSQTQWFMKSGSKRITTTRLLLLVNLLWFNTLTQMSMGSNSVS